MRKKLISKTYLRDINKYNINICIDNDEYYLSTKKIIDAEKTLITKNGVCIIDNGYYIVELIPKNKNYSMRVFLDNNKEVLEYYFDISLQNGLDDETKIPYYDDLYLDVVADANFENITILDEDELKEAYEKNEITKDQFELANHEKDKLVEELREKKNPYMTIEWKEILKF